MATSKVLLDTFDTLIIELTHKFADTTQESAVVKVDKSAYTGPNGSEPGSFVVKQIYGEVVGCNITIKANRTSMITIAELGGMGKVKIDFTNHGKTSGFQTKGSGGTGDIEFTSDNQSAGDSYTLVLVLRKRD